MLSLRWTTGHRNENTWGLFTCLECNLIAASALLSKCGIYLLLKLGMWRN